MGELDDGRAGKAGREETDGALAEKAPLADVHRWLQGKANAEELTNQAAQRARETGQALSQKVEAGELRQACEHMETRMTLAADETRSALLGALAAKTDKVHVEAVVTQLLLKSNVKDALTLIERKADVDDVNRSLTEVNRELSLRPTLTELNRVVGEQSLIMESLCSEHLLGRWIWKSGRTRGEKHTVPWNVQNINTNPENFVWEQDKCAITCTAPGLYEVHFGFFTRRKPTVQLLVNGEPVLSAVNSASYAVHHSSGRLAAVGPHSAGNVTGDTHPHQPPRRPLHARARAIITRHYHAGARRSAGLTLLDFLALPPKARVAISYQGDEGGEGFLGLRKL